MNLKNIIPLIFLLYHGNSTNAQEHLLPSLARDGNVINISIETESGLQEFTLNAGLAKGANKDKIFGVRKPTTLWSDQRRISCYETSIRIAVQTPLLSEDHKYQEYLLKTLSKLGLANEVLSDLTSALNSLHTDYIDRTSLYGLLNNKISYGLRTIKSENH